MNHFSIHFQVTICEIHNLKFEVSESFFSIDTFKDIYHVKIIFILNKYCSFELFIK